MARYTTTTLATPVATAIAACMIGAQAAPPPWGTWEKNFTSLQPSKRAISYSGTLSTEYELNPSTSAGLMPASLRAANVASSARRSSVRPEFFENSVAPRPTMAARPESDDCDM